MIRNYFKIAWRNILSNKASSAINIGGLAVGMAVAILISLWIHKEMTYNKYHENYNTIAQVWQNQTYNGKIGSQVANPAVMAETIRNEFGSDFKYVIQSSWTNELTLTHGDKAFFKLGNYFEPEVIDMLSLKMIRGNSDGLKKMHSIILSESVAEVFFGTEDPIGKTIKLDNKVDVNVTGVYEDIPQNNSLKDVSFMLPWDLYLSRNPWIKKMEDPWGSNFTQTYAQIAPNTNFEDLSKKIKDVKLTKLNDESKLYNPQVFLHPMSRWHLYSNFENGINNGGRIDNVWLFAIIGIFVLLLACINFMNLSTARSEKRAKEVGIRKAIGSKRSQLISQFFSESVLISLFAFLLSILLVLVMLPYFNRIADANITIPWTNPIFWIIGLFFSILTGLIAGIYPALYLSSFNPVKVLKGTLQTGRYSSLPRKVLVVSQFAISITLIIGTIVVYQQINHAQNRPLGYEKNGLISVSSNDEAHKHISAIRSTLIDNGAIIEMTESQSPMTDVWNTNGGISWEGKDPNLAVDFPNNAVNYEFGKTIGWKIKEGRDFSRDFGTDSLAFILNESAVTFMNLKDPIGKIIRWNNNPYTIIGVVEDMLVQSPYKPVRASLFHLSNVEENLFTIKLNPAISVKESMSKVEAAFKTYNPAIPFDANFVDEDFARKFGNEKRIGELAAFFTILAIFISCLGLFGLASYVAEQRTKEIGIRKVLGATVVTLWQMLSKDFITLVFIACVIAVPIGYYFMDNWLQKFDYHTTISWWIFGLSCIGALIITLFTVSYQAIKAALANPVKSIKTE
ncbi:ABC transporter permease [Urechidicola croceus]|uniref:ABC transporter permease n=1 Tax=Urechidicola croceus TaxID=1850246 RepID=A0A1D8P5L3_9FLAO|nr:FtsX-like permease family protein [Urechidicola croceus]AOW19882.1 ABC transporter permease [Urechidicola croceus]